MRSPDINHPQFFSWTIFRSNLTDIREKRYEDQNRGIYMFRLDDERVVDATMTGGVARYINHSCDPNCVTETVELADTHIIIFAARRINRGEELSYDYKVSRQYILLILL